MQFDQLGPYRIGKRIGRGGMGEVFEGAHNQTGEQVAIKVLNPALAQAEDFRQRFEAEIDSLRQLRHPNIVQMYGFGEQDGYLFYSMELVRGHSLEEELNAGRRFNWREVTAIGIQLSKALKHAHDHGIIHRDLKPANVLLTDDECVKLLDFGIARLFGETQLTSVGGVLGTADYMSPEQADGRPVTERCDQYGLGGVLYTLAAGRPPFRARTVPELLQLQRYAQPEPVGCYAADLPAELEAIIMQLLEKDPHRRFRSLRVLARHMEAMERALSRPVEANDSDASVTGDEVDEGEPADATSETRFSDEADHAPSMQASPQDEPADAAADPRRHGLPRADRDRAEPQRSGERQFTTVDEAVRREHDAQREPWTVVVTGIAAVAAGLLLLGGGIFYFLQPLSADALYAKIEAAADGGGEDLIDAEQEIADFLATFPDDERADKVAALRREAEVGRAERRLRLRGRRTGNRQALTPIERMYVEALRLAESRPELARARLAALVDLYDDPTSSPAEQRCVARAQRQLARLVKEAEAGKSAIIAALEERLDHADQVAATLPDRAQKMYRAIIELCRDKPWAHQIAATAEARLQTFEPKLSAKDKDE